jgi:uncharacterized repeat protein (TIGR01451 family)
VDGVVIPGLSGQIIITDMPSGLYLVEWWNTHTGAIVKTEAVDADSDGLVLGLPAPLSEDVAVKASLMGPALSLSTKTVSRSTARPGDLLAYTITVVNAGTMNVTAIMTDQIPTGTVYVLGSASVMPANGDLDDVADIQWRGELGGGESVTITFAVQVEPGEDPFVVSNVAVIQAGSEYIQKRALTIVNARQVYLPFILKRG